MLFLFLTASTFILHLMDIFWDRDLIYSWFFVFFIVVSKVEAEVDVEAIMK